MPKRSNQFQKLVTYIAEQVYFVGATVRESVELPEQGLDNTITREVDVLIEASVGFAPIRIALECRDRSRKDDVQWIDALIGKYTNLQVDQVIAISSSGFSKKAKKKADLNRIITMSLEEASEANWPERFAKLGVARIDQSIQIVARSFITSPSFPRKIKPDDILRFLKTQANPEDLVPEEIDVKTFVEKASPVIIDHAKQYVLENALSIYKTLADLNKDALVEGSIPISGLLLVDENGNVYRIDGFRYVIVVQTQYSKLDVKRYLLSDKAMVTSALLQNEDNEVSISAVQVEGVFEGRLFIDSKQKHRNTTKKKQ